MTSGIGVSFDLYLTWNGACSGGAFLLALMARLSKKAVKSTYSVDSTVSLLRFTIFIPGLAGMVGYLVPLVFGQGVPLLASYGLGTVITMALGTTQPGK